MVALRDAIEAACPGVGLERNRRTDVDASETPYLVLRDGAHDADQGSSQDTAYRMTATVEGTVAAPVDDDLGPAVNALYLQVASCWGDDPSLGGLCVQIRETGFDPGFASAEESAVPLADFTLDLLIEFQTPDGDPAG